jgi:hypothetical protein
MPDACGLDKARTMRPPSNLNAKCHRGGSRRPRWQIELFDASVSGRRAQRRRFRRRCLRMGLEPIPRGALRLADF